MWQYFCGHAIYHLIRWFPVNNRFKIRILLMCFTMALLIPQIYVLFLPHSERYCPQPLFVFLLISIVSTFFLIGFAFLFSLLEPVAFQIKVAFHIYGLIILFIDAAYIVTLTITNELYFLSIALAAYGILSIIFFAIVLPFWLVNICYTDSILDRRNRDGFCYEPVLCCSCIWHI